MNRLIKAWFDNRGYDYDYMFKINDASHDNLKDIDTMCAELHQIHDTGAHIVILPDFDMDGIMSGVVGYAGMAELGFNVSLFRPDPSEGYGFFPDTIHRLVDEFSDVKAIITCDTGITCYDGVATAQQLGIKVLVTDHHVQEKDKNLGADIIVDPNRADETYKNGGICGAHVFWQVLSYYSHKYGTVNNVEQIDRLRVFAGIGTISDLMPLVYENRDLVRDSISICRLVWDNGNKFFIRNLTGSSVYVRAFYGLFTALQVFADNGKLKDVDSIDEEFFGYYLAPTFNSVKRMGGDMNTAFGVFFGNDPDVDANELYKLNEERKQIVAKYYADMMNSNQPYAPYVYISDAPGGILGLLATKVITAKGLPVMVLREDDDGHYTGSGRSPEWYRAIDIIAGNGFYIAGHQGAFGAGVSSYSELKRLHDFMKSTSEKIYASLDKVEDKPDIIISTYGDGTCGLDIPMILQFVNELKEYAPFGRGFEPPEIAFDFSPDNAEWITMGGLKQHVKGKFMFGFNLIIWNGVDKLMAIKSANKIRCYGRLSVNEFAGSKSVDFIADSVVCK